MKVLQVNNCDIPGRIFNGFDLHLALIEQGIDASQLVIDKYSDKKTVLELGINSLEREQIIYLEEKYCVKNVLFPYAEKYLKKIEKGNYDIVHFHFPYHNMFSLLDYPRIMDSNSVWTIHDLWMLTGNCTHPLECSGWKYGCRDCNKYDDSYFPMKYNNVEFMWKLKKDIYSKTNPHIIVASKYMEEFIRKSPLTCHFTNIHHIPFGIEIPDLKKRNNEKVVIGFRAEDAYIKGTYFLYKALEGLVEISNKIELQCVGSGKVPEDIKKKFKTKSYGWINDKEAMNEIMQDWDIFIMPSLAESFGLMAIEAMSYKCAVICFENTAVADITCAPRYAVTASYASSDDLMRKIKKLIDNKDIRLHYQFEGYEFVKKKYRFKDYVNKHIELYKEISGEKNE